MSNPREINIKYGGADMATIREILDKAGFENHSGLITPIKYADKEPPLVKSDDDIVIDPEVDTNGEVFEQFPSKEELDEHIRINSERREKEEFEKMNNLSSTSNKCGECVKFMRTTPNPKSKYGQCQTHATMVMMYQTGCESWAKSNRKNDGGLWPS